jgi:hypothetical protein
VTSTTASRATADPASHYRSATRPVRST